jgi:hypothetical protein
MDLVLFFSFFLAVSEKSCTFAHEIGDISQNQKKRYNEKAHYHVAVGMLRAG